MRELAGGTMGIRFAAVLGALLVACPAVAQTRPGEPSLLVSTAWLADHLRDPNVVVLQTSQGDPAREQIPGARLVPHHSLMVMGNSHDLADTSDLVTTLERAGVSNSSHVVVYGDPVEAGWLFFALDYLGHERTSLLDGGLDKWKAEGRPVSPVGAPPPSGRFQPRLRPRVKASADTVRNRAPGAVALLDARSEKEYAAGHISGAQLLMWQEVYSDTKLQVFKSPADVRALFAAAGASSGKSAITYCQLGLRSSLLYFAARYAGLNVSNYVGSWSEWTAKGLPVERAR
jgi:thiosulfate/3-mercaptopyruvate sulfurtransferase